jgi:hypothetical protein
MLLAAPGAMAGRSPSGGEAGRLRMSPVWHPDPVQTASKFPFRWWGANSTLSDRYQLDELPGPYSTQNEVLDISELRYANARDYAGLVRSASFPTGVNGILARFALWTCRKGGTKILANTDLETTPGVSRRDVSEAQRCSHHQMQAEHRHSPISPSQGGAGERDVTAPFC